MRETLDMRIDEMAESMNGHPDPISEFIQHWIYLDIYEDLSVELDSDEELDEPMHEVFYSMTSAAFHRAIGHVPELKKWLRPVLKLMDDDKLQDWLYKYHNIGEILSGEESVSADDLEVRGYVTPESAKELANDWISWKEMKEELEDQQRYYLREHITPKFRRILASLDKVHEKILEIDDEE